MASPPAGRRAAYPWSLVLEAQGGLADNTHVGKIVLEAAPQI
ncbi:hypothetical protein [Nocardia fusca]|uniref:Uncharacterized protein n=1 Tax=Nocardia fusca TaxID=941183 RepID=A0ABV3F0X2_9NOCA